ncbi:MAG: phage virion morphogenesis protein [Flavobacteriales bacterium]
MSKQFPHPFSGMAGRYRRFRRDLPRIASVMALNEFKGNFRRQGFRTRAGNVEKWAPRKRLANGRAILIQTGRLRRALKAAPTYQFARVVNNTPYAAIHNRGGRIKGEMQALSSNLRSKMARMRPSGQPAMMPARPYMMGTKPLVDDISKEILTGLGEVFNGGKSA